MNNSLQEQREMNQFAFFSLSHEANNRFDYIADEAIMRLETEIEKSCEAYSQLESIRQNEPEKWKRMEREAHERDMDLSGEFNSYALDTVYRTEEMIVLMEMKVIYAWKHLEIYIKKLISEAYPEINTKDFYEAIDRELYHFNQVRIESLAKSLILRMDKEAAKKFSETFDKLYQFDH